MIYNSSKSVVDIAGVHGAKGSGFDPPWKFFYNFFYHIPESCCPFFINISQNIFAANSRNILLLNTKFISRNSLLMNTKFFHEIFCVQSRNSMWLNTKLISQQLLLLKGCWQLHLVTDHELGHSFWDSVMKI